MSHQHAPVQLSLFEQETLSVESVSKRFRTSMQTVRRLLDRGDLRGYRITSNGWWNIYRASVEAFEARLQGQYGAFLAELEAEDSGRKGPKKP